MTGLNRPLRVALFGSTGSIGESTLRVTDESEGRIDLVALIAGTNGDRLAAQVARHEPQFAALFDETAARAWRNPCDTTTFYSGPDGIASLLKELEVDVLINAIVGAAGLETTLAAMGRVKRIALANKESLVVAGEPVMRAAARTNTELIPIDSEHSALHQCLEGRLPDEVSRLVLTASGGPFRESSMRQIRNATRAEALNHPTWDMGPKITVDSATLMNKGLEVIEAIHLFGFSADKIGVVVHPESIVHSLVELRDGSYIAQLGETDMAHPIRYALSYPERWEAPGHFDLASLSGLHFEEPDRERFPCLALAFRAAETGGVSPAVLNAANEIAVAAFLDEKILLGGIPDLVTEALEEAATVIEPNLEDILRADREARERVARRITTAAGT